MRRQATTVLAAAILGGMALAVSGCGSKSATKTNAPPTRTAPRTTSAAATRAAAAATAKLRLTLLTAKNCEQLYDLARDFSTAMTGSGGDLDKDVVVLNEFAAKSPLGIRPAFQVLATASAKIAAALNGLNLQATPSLSKATLAKMNELSNEIDMMKLDAASTSIGTWASKNCSSYVPDSPLRGPPPEP